MRSAKKSHGVEPEDVDLLFPESPAGSPDPITPIDFKRRQSGEWDDRPDPEAEERSWPIGDLEPAEPPPDFSSEPWPEPVEDAPENGSLTVKQPIGNRYEPGPLDEEIDLDPQRERRAAVQELGKATGRAMIDGTIDPKPKPLERVRGEKSPSDKSWREELVWILEGRR